MIIRNMDVCPFYSQDKNANTAFPLYVNPFDTIMDQDPTLLRMENSFQSQRSENLEQLHRKNTVHVQFQVLRC